MINETELRLGNFILQKLNGKISMVPCSYQHFELMHKGDIASFYPVVLKPELFEKSGFIENKKAARFSIDPNPSTFWKIF